MFNHSAFCVMAMLTILWIEQIDFAPFTLSVGSHHPYGSVYKNQMKWIYYVYGFTVRQQRTNRLHKRIEYDAHNAMQIDREFVRVQDLKIGSRTFNSQFTSIHHTKCCVRLGKKCGSWFFWRHYFLSSPLAFFCSSFEIIQCGLFTPLENVYVRTCACNRNASYKLL